MAQKSYLPCKVVPVTNLTKLTTWDCICVVDKYAITNLSQTFSACRKYDEAFDKEVSCLTCSELNCRIVYSPVGELADYDDVRNYEKAAAKGIARAIKAGSKSPILVLPENTKYENAGLSALLGALRELYVPIQLREDVPEKKERFPTLGVFMENQKKLNEIIESAVIFGSGLFVARDIGMGDPERMAPPRVVDYVSELFPSSGPIKMTVVSDVDVLTKEYPLFQAVNRAAVSVERHRGRIIYLEYKPPNPAKRTILLVGKGVTYDTGGADIKAGGVMAGMCRDKCGAAALAGFMKVVSDKKPSDLHVIVALCMVRNSVGEECYVSDEVISSRANVRVRVGNTDAEGRMCMADALCKFKELAQTLPNPHIYTVATLTGHACLAVGDGYSICIDNGPARADGHSYKLKEISEIIGDPFEISTLRREDFEFHGGKVYGEDVLQCNNLPSSRTPRGHITPAAFLILASGLDKHGLNSSKPIKYSHLDIAASAGEFPLVPSGAPILALAKSLL